jgi:hypothetical protein
VWCNQQLTVYLSLMQRLVAYQFPSFPPFSVVTFQQFSYSFSSS